MNRHSQLYEQCKSISKRCRAAEDDLFHKTNQVEALSQRHDRMAERFKTMEEQLVKYENEIQEL